MRKSMCVLFVSVGMLLTLLLLSPATADSPAARLEEITALTPTPAAFTPTPVVFPFEGTPTPKPSPEPKLASPYTLWISVDRCEGATYWTCEPIQICYGVPYPVYIRIWLETWECDSIIAQGYDDGTGGCFPWSVVGLPTGNHWLTIEMIEGGQVTSSASTWFYVRDSGPASAQIWPDRGEGATYRIGDPLQLCFWVSRAAYIEIWKTTSQGSALLAYGNVTQGGNYCLDWRDVGEPPGTHSYRLDVYECVACGYSWRLTWDETWVNVAPVCNDDPYEPNDSFQQAYSIQKDITYRGYICPSGDKDYFKIHALLGDRLTARLTSLPANYDLYLYDENYNQIGSSMNSGTTDEQIDYTVSGIPHFGTDLYIKAIGRSTAWNGNDSYELRVQVLAPNVRVSGSLSLSKTSAMPGEDVTANFTIHNYGNAAFDAQLLGVGGRGPGGEGDIQDFPFVQGPFTLLPGHDYTYTGTRSFSAPGQYHFGVVYQDYDGHWHDIPADPGVSREAILQVVDIATLTGVVTHGDGANKGLRGVTVSLSGPVSRSTTTDQAGNFSFSGLPYGNYTIEARLTGYTRYSASLTINQPSVVHNIRIVPNLRVSASLQLSKNAVYQDEEVIATVKLHNYGSEPFTTQQLGIGGRGPHPDQPGRVTDFPLIQTPVTIQPGQDYELPLDNRRRRFLNEPPGQYLFFVAYQDMQGNWPDVPSDPGQSREAWLTVHAIDLRVTGSLSVNPNPAQVGAPVEATFTVKNFGPLAYTPRQLFVRGRGPDGIVRDFIYVDPTLQPGQEYEYRQSRLFDQVGQYDLDVAYQDASGAWREVPANPGIIRSIVLKVGQIVEDAVKIKEIKVQGIGTTNNNPETGSPVRLEAEIEVKTGYELTKCSWTGDLTPGPIPVPVPTPPPPQKTCVHEYIPNTGPGPAPSTYGEKNVTLNITFKQTVSGLTGQVSKDHKYKVFFRKGSPGSWGDDDGDDLPNWFQYWRRDDGAVPQLAQANYNATMSAYGCWNCTPGIIELGNSAAGTHYPGGINVPAVANRCPGGNFGGAQGIDTATEVFEHENHHRWIDLQWNSPPPAGWQGLTDSDRHVDANGNFCSDCNDKLPDDYEVSTTTTSTGAVDSCNLARYKSLEYAFYGDNEFAAMTYSNGRTGNASNDWANPGKQSNPPFAETTLAQVKASELGARSGPAGPYAPYGTAALLASGMAKLTGSYSDTGVDTDSDGLFNSLKVSVGVQVTQTAVYNLVGWLKDGIGKEIAWASTPGTLITGTHTVDLFFNGQVIRSSGLNGPYKISRIELRVGDEEQLEDGANNAHTTAGYRATDFDPRLVEFSESFSDTGVDTNTDGLYDLLWITLGLEVQEAGTYTVTGELEGSEAIAVARTTASLSMGGQTVNLDFDGQLIFQHRQNGPYKLKALRIEDANRNRIDFIYDAFLTRAYNYRQFQHGGTTIDAASYSDQGLDVDGDGDYDFLRVSLRVDVGQAGSYRLIANLKDSEGGTIESIIQDLNLLVGPSAISLDFSGGAILKHGVDGPYQVASVALLDADGTIVDHQQMAHTTAAYSHLDFEGVSRIYLPLILKNHS